MFNHKMTPQFFNDLSKGHFPELLGIKITKVEEGNLTASMSIEKKFYAPNGFLHGGSLVSFADTVAGYASISHLPENGKSFTTLELKTNFLKAKREGTLTCECIAEHLGRTTQVWRVNISDQDSDKKIAVFSCTQMILY